jgi:ADP-dependent NAD(P)H-hydrate dehydratase / NAD(P)H-hydrate epimerase
MSPRASPGRHEAKGLTGPILSREQMRAYDARAIEVCSVPGLVLMENAGRGAADVAAELGGHGPVVIVCGTGNNGGDGFVVARHLLARGIYAHALLLGRAADVRGDARAMLGALVGLGGDVTEVEEDDTAALEEALEVATLVVDAMFGTGLSRPLEGRWLAAVAAINAAECPCVALDIPSGIDAVSGAVLGAAVRADVTVTFAHPKSGLVQGAGVVHSGDVVTVGLGIADAGILEEVGAEARFIDPAEVKAALGERAVDTHKYTAGSVLVVAGSAGKTGAALLAARAVLRGGGGLATIATWPEALAAMHAQPEIMTVALDADDPQGSLAQALERRAAVAIGPGLGLDARARAIVEEVVLGWAGPVVVDADALGHFAGRAEALREAKGPRVLTPHAGELARLLGSDSRRIEAHRFAAARRAAEVTRATVVLKGPRTIVATADRLDVCGEGNAVLGTGGTGDVLAGLTAALLCRQAPHEAACGAVLLHARAADRWRVRVGADRGLLAGELADAIPDALGSL